jgi:hypothetical protein
MARDTAAIAISIVSLLVSVGSMWETDRQRRSTERSTVVSERSEALAEKVARDSQRLTEVINRPWVTVSAVVLQGGSRAPTGIEFRFKNGGPVPAVGLKVTPGISWDARENLDKDLTEAEKDSAMDAGDVPAGDFRSVIMPAAEIPGFAAASKSNHVIIYCVIWRYADASRKEHVCRLFGHCDRYSQMFTMDSSHIE